MSPAKLLSEASLWEWSFFAVAIALLVMLRWALPPDRRRRLLLPFTLVLFNLFLLPLRALPGTSARVAQAFRLAGAFFVVLALVHLVLLMLFEGTALTRGRVPRIVQDVVIALVYFVATMGLFGASGVELSSLLTTSALLTAVVGFALQDTLGNVVSGLAIQVKRPFSIGDWVSLDGKPENYGRVVEVNWRATRVVTNENVTVIVPNANIAKGTVLNFSEPTPVVRRSIRVSVTYDVPPSRVEEIALRAMRASPGVLEEPPPECVLSEFGDSGIEYWCRFFIDDFRRRDVLVGGVAARLYYDFLREDIQIPYPIRTVHLHQRGDEQETRDRERRGQRLAAHFEAIDFLAPLGPEVLRELAARVRTVAYGRGERVVSEGEEGADLFVLERGQVAVTVEGGAQAREIARLGPGDFFGEMSLMTGEARRATVVALGDVEAVRVDKDSFREVLARSPHVLDEIGRVLAARQAALDADAAAASAGAAGPGLDQRSHALISRIRGFFRL
jgi:small-conductance mechanosensitive channel/CRP-like cAMP-binding protein